MQDPPLTVYDLLSDPACQRDMVRLCSLIARSAADLIEGDDLLQDVYVRALRGAPSFRGQSRAEFLAWIERIAVNVVRDLVRKAKRRPRQAPMPAEPVAERAGLAPELASPEMLLSIYVTAEELALLQARLAGLDYRHIARNLRITPEAARQRYSRALRRLVEFRRQVEG